MLKISYAACLCLSQLVLAQFALEKCLAAQNRQKIYKKPYLRSSKIIEIGGNREPVYDFLLVINSNIDLISHRYWDTATYWPKIANFDHPSYLALSFGVTPFEFMKNFTAPKSRVFRAAGSKNLVILACTVFDWSTRVTDGQTDRQTNGQTELRRHDALKAVGLVAFARNNCGKWRDVVE